MNTPVSPRDVLLARHAAVRPALDSQRDALLARFAVAPSPATSAAMVVVVSSRALSPRVVFEVLWRELFVPCRGAWVAFACVWVAILAFDRLHASAAVPEYSTEVARSDSAWLAVWLEQRRLLVEMARDPFAPAVPPPPASPVPAVPPLGFIDIASNPICPV